MLVVGVASCVLRPRSCRPIASTATSTSSLKTFGARAGCAWRETDEADTDLETVLQGLLSGQYVYPVRIVCFNASEGWSRDATSDVADALAQRAADNDDEVSAALQGFIAANCTRRFDVQLALPLRGAA
jgi:hypothetical protein